MTSADRPTRSAPCKKKRGTACICLPDTAPPFGCSRSASAPSRPGLFRAFLQARQSRAAFGVWASALAAEPRAFSCARYSECWIYFLRRLEPSFFANFNMLKYIVKERPRGQEQATLLDPLSHVLPSLSVPILLLHTLGFDDFKELASPSSDN